MSDEPKIKIDPVEYMRRLRKIEDFDLQDFPIKRKLQRLRNIKDKQTGKQYWGGKTTILNSRVQIGASRLDQEADEKLTIENLMRELRITKED